MLKKKVQGGALYIALIITIITGVILSVFILITHYNQRKVISQLGYQQLEFNLKSGLQIAQSDYFLRASNNMWIKLYDDETETRIKKLQWGSYDMICVESRNNHQRLKQCGLYGVRAYSDTAIITTEKGRPIGLAGEIKFNGKCFFPKAGIKPAFIEGKSFNPIGNLNAFLAPAPGAIPEVNKTLVDAISKNANELDPKTDSLFPFIPDVLKNDFSSKTVVIECDPGIIANKRLEGNIKLLSKRKIVINESNSFEDILIITKTVHFRKGFKGSVHVIASDSIVIEDDCLFEFPSSFTVLSDESNTSSLKGIYFGKACTFFGSLMAIKSKQTEENSKVFVQLNTDTKVYGLLYSQDYCHVQGKVFGTVMASSLLLKTPSAAYENYILDAELDPKKYASTLAIPRIQSSEKNYICCKWL